MQCFFPRFHYQQPRVCQQRGKSGLPPPVTPWPGGRSAVSRSLHSPPCQAGLPMTVRAPTQGHRQSRPGCCWGQWPQGPHGERMPLCILLLYWSSPSHSRSQEKQARRSLHPRQAGSPQRGAAWYSKLCTPSKMLSAHPLHLTLHSSGLMS